MKSYSDILAALEARKDRSAWNKGVTAYAIDLLDQYQERCSSKREADAVARAWNESYKRNGTALF